MQTGHCKQHSLVLTEIVIFDMRHGATLGVSVVVLFQRDLCLSINKITMMIIVIIVINAFTVALAQYERH